MSLGPRSYAEIFDWPAKGLESIAAACKCRGRDAMAYLQGLMSCSAEIVLTTHFSGMGTSEMALAMIEDMLQQHGISLPMRVHSATDFNQDCRKVLMSYQPPHGPEHVFGDILDRLPEQAKDRLIARQLYYKQQFEKGFRQWDFAAWRRVQAQLGQGSRQPVHPRDDQHPSPGTRHAL